MDKKETKIFLNIESSSKDDLDEPEELERVTHNLRDDLTELDAVEKVDLVTKGITAPKHSKSGGEIITLGSLLITLGGSLASNFVPNLASTLQSWLTRNEKRKISLEIGGDKMEVAGISDKEQQKLIEAWISHHTEKS